ncbi:MAG: glycosyltransferase family 2 protein [Thermonemataceae bacterium]|nr:glycosyltransferase family 2 protein [Thermonemataceae bacterium]
MFLPKISVITVCYNAEQHLERTFQSVFSQNYPFIEYLVFDGKSTDNTITIIKKYEQKISFWQSEQDSGLYEAMNKALAKASGEYLIFMNAGDTFFANDTLTKVFESKENADIYYGEAQILAAETFKVIGLRSEITPLSLPPQLTWRSLRWGMCVSHQAFIVKRSIATTYDLSYKYSADIDWVIRCLKEAKHIVHTNLVIANFILGGLSSQKRKKSLEERYKILKKHYGFFSNIFNHCWILLRGIFFILKKRKKYWD